MSPGHRAVLPERIAELYDISRNMSWSWSREARALFRALDPPLWHLSRHNAVSLLQRVEQARLDACAQDAAFLERYDAAVSLRRYYEVAPTWFPTAYPDLAKGFIAYFCAEFGLHNSVPIYSGGLGILAGDHCKAASDLGVPLVGVGLLYTRGYFDQRVRLDGWQEDADESFDVSLTPLDRVLGTNGDPCLATVHTSGRPVRVGAWRVQAGRVPIYLIDTDFEGNDPADRELCHRLYAGSNDLRLRQEWILGVGGVRVLRTLGAQPVAWHANEGHAAFMLLERVRELTAAGTPFDEAVKAVRRNSIFTTHTPVPAGHDAFSSAQLEACAGPVWDQLRVPKEAFLGLGHDPHRDSGTFHMPVLAIRLSGRVNGVSRRHGEVSRRIWSALWPGRELAKVPIGHVTNGVHATTWMSHHMGEMFTRQFGPDWPAKSAEPRFWEGVLEFDDGALWAMHQELKFILTRTIRDVARERWAQQWRAEALHLIGAGTMLDERALTIGFARRFATYKRANLLLKDVDRLRRLLTNVWRPVQVVFAGKAHPADEPGKKVLQAVYDLTRDARFEGRIAFIEDYEMHLAHRLVQGVDLWLNLPRVPLEACGTSGMKAALNGVPQLSTLDGWWEEGFDKRNGWAIPPAPTGADADAADAADAEGLYRLLEEEVVPLYYSRDVRGIPVGWVQKMKHAIRVAGERFTADRMVRQYVTEYYVPAARGGPAQPPDDPPPAK